MSQTRSQMGGSTISFIFVGSILILFIVGGLYALKSRSDSLAVKTSPSPKPTAQIQEKVRNAGSARPGSKTEPRSAQTNKGSNNQSLPATGPAQDVLALISLPLLTAAIVSYAQSRSNRASLRLR
ncbi:hypothetical protein KC953_00030 [Candidatus Saccharibacteria bacterium]|nr:hypothetical protein [Candidatus Saccharibacteria bacterium]